MKAVVLIHIKNGNCDVILNSDNYAEDTTKLISNKQKLKKTARLFKSTT